MQGRSMTVDEVMHEVLRDRLFYDESGGGVTISGGEPLLQADFSCAACYVPAEPSRYTRPLTLRAYAPRKTAARSGAARGPVPLRPESARRFAASTPHRRLQSTILDESAGAGDISTTRIWIRVPLIPGFNDDANTAGHSPSTLPPFPACSRSTSCRITSWVSTSAHRRWQRQPSHRNSVSDQQLQVAADAFRACGLNTTDRWLIHDRPHRSPASGQLECRPVHLCANGLELLTDFYQSEAGKVLDPRDACALVLRTCASRRRCISAKEELIVGERGPHPKAVPTFPGTDLPQPGRPGHSERTPQDQLSCLARLPRRFTPRR